MRYFFNFLWIIFLMCCQAGLAQNYPVYNSFYINPYLYNPAEALTDHTQIFAVYRQQWMNIEGAPTLMAVSYTTLMNQSRAGYGGKISSYKRGILNTTDVSLTYAYAIPMGQRNWLYLALSGGAISNSIDLTQVTNPNDPALSTYMADNMQPAGNFGILYRSGSGINVGLALPQLFPPLFNSNASFSNTTVSPSDNVFFTIYYKRKVDSKIVTRSKAGMKRKIKTEETIAPLEVYFNYKYSKYKTSQFEFLGKLNLSQYFWLGGSYRLPYGYTANVGLNVSRLTLSYSYEPNSQPEDGFSQGTHEMVLGLKLGGLKKLKRATPILKSTLVKAPNQKHAARFQETIEDPDKINQDQTITKKYYVVIRAFADFNSADVYKKKLIGELFNAEIFYNPQDRKYYVHVLETTKVSEAHEEIKNLKAYTKLKEARLLQVTVSDKK